MRVLLILAQFAISVLARDEVYPKVTSIEPHEASYMGGTRLYIHGQGFSSGGNFNATGPIAPGNKAFLISDHTKIPCDVENDASHETMIVCYTRPMERDVEYFVQIEVDGYEVPFRENCNNHPRNWRCRFIPRWWFTPYLADCHATERTDYPMQKSHEPGHLISCSGRIFTQIYGSNNQTNENGRTVSIRRVYVGGMKCELLEQPDIFYDLRLISGDTGTFTCKPQGKFVGVQNVSLILTDQFGRADVDIGLFKTNSKDKVYNFQTYAEITGIWPHTGSLEGGTRVSITGKNFDDTTEPVKVFIGGVPCDIIPGTLTSGGVECFAGQPPAMKNYYTGSRGIILEIWNETRIDNDASLKLNSSSENYETTKNLDSTGYQWNDEKDNFVAKYTGVFLAPKTDRYRFQIAADDDASLYMNCEGLMKLENLTKIAYAKTPSKSFTYNNQFSEWMELSEGQECFFVGVVQELGGLAYMYIAVHRATTTLTATQSIDAKNEIQMIDFSARFLKEKQVVNFTGWSNQSSVIEEQEITVSHSCISNGNCVNVGYRLVYEGVKTVLITADASASTVRDALRNIFELGDENIEVSVAMGTTERNYTVRFNGKRGDYSDLRFEKHASNASGLSITIIEKTKGVADMMSFKLRLGGRATTAIPRDASLMTIQAALNRALDAHCPSFLLPDRRKSTVLTTIDYEATKYGEEWGKRRTNIEAFCGRTSVINCDYVYFAGRTADSEDRRHTAFDAVQNRWLCLAHRGLMAGYLQLTGTFTGSERTISGTYSLTNPLSTHETEWRYSCMDFLQLIRSRSDFAHVYQVELSRIRFFRKGRDYSFFLDAITIGSEKTTDDLEGVLGFRTPPALANGHPLRDVSVKEIDTDGKAYEIEIDSYDCGDQLPLISTSTAMNNGFVTTRLVSGVTPMSGTFDLTVNFNDGRSYNVTDVDVDISEEKFAERLELEAPGFGQARARREGGCHARDYVIEWLTNGGDKPLMQLHADGLQAASDINFKVYTKQDGGILHNPMTGDITKLAYSQPQVEVMINGYASKCLGDCHFAATEDATPVISGINPTNGSAQLGTSITIYGSNLDAAVSYSTTVTIGEADCSVTSNNSTRITCDLGDGALGTYNVIVNIGGKGFASHRVGGVAMTITFNISGGILSISPPNGYSSGGTEVVISGYGFSNSSTFVFGSAPCEILERNATQVSCIAPANSIGSVPVSAKDGEIDLTSLSSFEYQETDAYVSEISPSISLVSGGQNLTISGKNFGVAGVKVLIGASLCLVLKTSMSEIVCSFPSMAPGYYQLKVTIPNRGFANISTNGVPMIEYNLEVTSISPQYASINGGTKMAIHGSGFDVDRTKVKFGETNCKIDSVTSSIIKCTTSRFTKVYSVTNKGRPQARSEGFTWDPLNLNVNVGDTVVWSWKFPGAEGGWSYGARVFTTASADSDIYDNVTFQSSTEKSAEGSFSYTFNSEGTFYVSSGRVDHPDWGWITMRQSIFVGPALAAKHKLNVSASGYEAAYNTAGEPETSGFSSCGGIVSSVNGCFSTSIEDDSLEFFVTSGPCYTPTVTSISPNKGTSATIITIEGNGFSTENCANKVIIGEGFGGEYECKVLSSTATNITCFPVPTEATPINVAFKVKVHVDSMGDANSVIRLDSNRRFTILPTISSVVPMIGSLEGGTLVIISGSGFMKPTGLNVVTIGGYSCEIRYSSYFEIQCLTPPSASEGKKEMAITVNGQPAECNATICAFEYDADSTPTVNHISQTSITLPNTELVFTGERFSANSSLIHVKIGDRICSVKGSNATEIRCSIDVLPAGPHSVQLTIDDKGLGKFVGISRTVTSVAVITSMIPVNGSKAGGTELTFVGNGFKSEDLNVKVANTPCPIVENSVTNFMFKCKTPPKSFGSKTVSITANGQSFNTLSFEYDRILTPEITSIEPLVGKAGDTVRINGTRLLPGDMMVQIGNAFCANISGDNLSITCVLQEHFGGQYKVHAVVGVLGFALSDLFFNYTFSVSSISPSNGSHAGGDMITISGKGLSERAVVRICDNVCDRRTELAGSTSSIAQIICRVPDSNSADVETDKGCGITVSIDGQSATTEGVLYTYAVEKTPKVTGIVPSRGGTQGGTTVTITGVLFDDDISKVSVEIAGVPCNVTSSTPTEIRCVTNSRGLSEKALVKVSIDGRGLAINADVMFYYVDVWSSRWTWGGRDPPVSGDFVVVPVGQTLLVDVDTPVLKMLLIKGGVAIFDEKDIHFQAENILITDGGVLQVGTEEQPFQHKALITLHGHLRSPELPIYGTKTIGVRNGTLDLHGMYLPVTWTHLRETALAGSKEIRLKEAVSWKTGDEIVIATTGGRHSQKETETAIITAVSEDNMTLTVKNPLIYTHISEAEQFDGVLLETRAEVGLLTRNIVVQGSTHLEWSKEKIPACEEGFNTGEFVTQTCFQGRFGEEEGSDQFGAQIMIHHRAPDLDIARARLEYVELRNVGQAFRLGRYPIHFHLLGDVGFRNYIKGCSIHRSFNRAITIHNTHHLLISRNVIYDIMGGAVFIEDGIEHGNVIEQNLVLFCKQSTSLQNDDITPAAFWVTNPNNTLRHNAAAGGTHFGFWYRIHSTPDGPSADPNICQQLHPLQSFQNNTVHSQGWFGLWVFQRYTPRGDGSCGSSSPTVAEFRSLTVWNCEKGAELVNVGAIKFFDFVMAHNSKAGIETKLIVDTKVRWGQVGTYNSFIIANSEALKTGGPTKRGVILPFTEAYEVVNTKFINFNETGTAAIGLTSITGTCSVNCGGWEARFLNTSFQNSPNKGAFRWEHEVSLRDMDGTLTGNGKESVIVPYNPTLSLTNCPKVDEFDVGAVYGVICDGKVKFHRVSWNQVNPTSLQAKNVTFTTVDGSTFIPFEKKRLTHKFGWMGTMLDGKTYRWVFQDAEHITNISYKAGFYNFEEKDCVIVSHNLTQKPDKFQIAGGSIDAAKDDMVSCDSNYHGDYYFDAGTKTLFYVVSGRNRPSRKKRFVAESATEGAVNREINFRVYRCFYKDCIPPPDPNTIPPVRARPTNYQIWHDNSYWKLSSDGEYVGTTSGDDKTSFPPASQDIRIESGTWMVVKQDLNSINKLWIEGVLEIEFDDENLNVTLSATHIIINGGRLIVGWEDASFKGRINIVMRGNHDTEDILLNGGINLGSKAIGVIGGLDLHGRERALRTTHLASTLLPAQNTITIDGSPNDWVEGDEIVIATTSADPWETETFKIMSVNDKTITLNASAKFEHIAETFSYSGDDSTAKSYDIKAEVSMLSRNIKVIGEDYSALFEESFGARILVAGAGSGKARGYARIENVEFYHSGQEGFIDNYDPRYSLAFLNTGAVDSVKPSLIKRNTFHNGFNTAIGVFGASGLDVVENTIHHTVGPGIRVEGENITLDRNLVMLARTRSVYQDRVESDIMLWKAAIEVNLARSPKLTGNVVAGSERAGFRIDGHDCSDTASNVVEWGWNTARATLQGVFLNKDGFVSCTHVSKFKIHNAHDNGVYCQVEGSVKMSDILITDSNFGFSAIVYSPTSLSHVMRNKRVTIQNSVVVAISKPGYCTALDNDKDYVKNSVHARPLRRTGANKYSRAAILWPAFISSQNSAPSKPFLGSMSYPAIGGKTIVKNLTFVSFGDTTCSPDHSIFLTNLKIEDFLHPIETSNLKFVNSPEETWFFFHRPSLGAINPSDCVDMECDGMKKALLVDKDGSMLGKAGSSVFPQAEFEWDGDPRRGLGDYRIPKTLLTALDGSKIAPSVLVPNKGIIRENTAATICAKKDAWNAHTCTGYHYGILVAESMDEDTETRRLSPVALKVDKYIDLNNGPQDHGWCAGYTCQERLSTFWMIVAMKKTYELHFTGTAPRKLRLRLLNEDRDTKMVLKTYYSRPQRMDVYVDGLYQRPLNFALTEDGQESVQPETYPGQYFATTDNYTGANFHDRTAQILHVTIGGGDQTVVEIREAMVVVISFRLPAVSPDEFFDNGKLVENLALFLKIPTYKIRLVNAVREGSSRKKREAVGDYTATVEIGDPPAGTIVDAASATTGMPVTGGTTAAPTSAPTSFESLENLTATVTNALQEGSLGDRIGTDVSSVAVVEPRVEAVRNANLTNSTTNELEKTDEYYLPTGLKVIQQPRTGNAGSLFSPVLTVTGIDRDGKDIILGHSSDRWLATVTVEGKGKSATLSGTTTAEFGDDGLAKFHDLSISVPGEYVLRVSVTYPAGQSALTVITDQFIVEEAMTTSIITTTPGPVVTAVSDLVIIIISSCLGVLILVVIIVAVITKGPCSKNGSRIKVPQIELLSWKPRSSNVIHPSSSEAVSQKESVGESQQPNAAMETFEDSTTTSENPAD